MACKKFSATALWKKLSLYFCTSHIKQSKVSALIAFTCAMTQEQASVDGGSATSCATAGAGASAIAPSCKIRKRSSISPCSPPSRSAEILTWSDTFRRRRRRQIPRAFFQRKTKPMPYNLKGGENRRTAWNPFPLDYRDCAGSSSWSVI